ncbi:MAG: N-acylglucosamine 2-epimerase, partial [Actinobacteria bacterium]
MGWFESIEHNRWLSEQMRALIAEAEGAIVPTGFAHLTPEGSADPERSIDLAVTARMLYVFSLGVLMGLPGSRRYADHAVRSITKYFVDPVNGGHYTAIKAEPSSDGHGVPWDSDGEGKSQFHNAFLILGAAAAAVADRPGAHELLTEALHDQERHWLEPNGLIRDQISGDYSTVLPIRSMDSLLHTAEAYLAAAEATTDPVWVERAEVMANFVYNNASGHNWRPIEYFDDQWKPLKELPKVLTDGRHVYEGTSTGHSMHWARIALHIRAAYRSMGRTQPEYLMDMATELFERARVDGWRRNGKPGFATTVDDNGEPLEKEHMQWVSCEGICAAVALRRAMLDDGASHGDVEHYEHCYRSWLDYVNDYLIKQPGRWVRMLTEDNEPVDGLKRSRWDV